MAVKKKGYNRATKSVSGGIRKSQVSQIKKYADEKLKVAVKTKILGKIGSRNPQNPPVVRPAVTAKNVGVKKKKRR
jgi:hypothetical protein